MFNNELWQKPAGGGGGGGGIYTYQIANSLFFNGTSHSLRKTWGSAASDDNKKALSFWIKRTGTTGTRSEIGSTLNTKLVSTNNFDQLEINTGNPSAPDQFHYGFGGGSVMNLMLQAWRDPSAWMHIIWIWNSDESTAVDRLKVYINGVNYVVTDTTYWNNNSGNPYPGSGDDSNFGKNGNTMHIADYQYNNAEWFGGQMAEWIMIDGAASYTDFGEFNNGVWVPKDPSGLTFGTNGFHLNFADASTPGNDVSGNNNDFANIGSIPASATLGDSPTFSATDGNGGNFMTYNGAMVGANNALAEGNLKSTGSSAGNNSGTFGMLTGKWYWECRAETVSAYGPTFGIGQFGAAGTDGQYNVITWQTSAGTMYGGGGYPVGMGTITVTSTGVTSLSSGDIMSFWLDCDNRKLWIGKNGTIPNSGNPATGANPQASWASNPTGRYFNATCQNVGSGAGVLNAGQNPTFNGAITAGTNTDKNGFGLFNYDPSGTDFIACCAANIPTAAAVDPAQTDDNYPQELFFMSQYTGNSTNRTITTENQPDLIFNRHWNYAQDWYVVDSTRGITANKVIITNNTDAESVLPQGNFTSVGATSVGISSGSWLNSPGTYYQMWMWRANGGTTSSNTQGDLTSTVQVDPSGGFSIVTYTGTLSGAGIETVGHGLSKAPNLIITKVLGQAGNWWVFSDGQTSWNYGMNLNNTNASADKSVNGSMSAPTSTVFDTNWTDGLNDEQGNIAYCFANTEGYIQSGTYRGNGNDDGTYIYTGFRPAMMIIKEYGAADNWLLYDDRRVGYNLDSAGNAVLYPDLNTAQENGASRAIDILSNGFKLRTSNGTGNASGGNYIYLAFAQNPFQYATAR